MLSAIPAKTYRPLGDVVRQVTGPGHMIFCWSWSWRDISSPEPPAEQGARGPVGRRAQGRQERERDGAAEEGSAPAPGLQMRDGSRAEPTLGEGGARQSPRPCAHQVGGLGTHGAGAAHGPQATAWGVSRRKATAVQRRAASPAASPPSTYLPTPRDPPTPTHQPKVFIAGVF